MSCDEIRTMEKEDRFAPMKLVHALGAAIAVITMFGVAPSDASATTILLTVPSSLVDQPPTPGPFHVDFLFGDELDGIVLSGQSLSLDLIFADGILARILGDADELAFSPSLGIQTDAGTFPGFAGAGSTGFLLAPDGSPLHDPLPPGLVGQTASSSGQFSVGLFPQIRNFDMSGIHFDVTLPSTGHKVTGGRLRLTNNSRDLRADFGTVAQLPDTAPHFWLISLVLFSMLFAAARQKAARR